MTASYSYKQFGSIKKVYLDVKYTVRMTVKDGKYRIECYGFYDKTVFGEFTTSAKCPRKFPMQKQSKTDDMWNESKQTIQANFEVMAISLSTYMNKNATIKNDDF